MSDHFMTLGRRSPLSLVGARIQLHYAAQAVSAPGASLLPAESDASHVSLNWDEPLGAIIGRPLLGTPVRAGLRVDEWKVIVANGPEVRFATSLAEKTLAHVTNWMTAALTTVLRRAARDLQLPNYVLPASALSRGGHFGEPTEETTEVGRWFAAAAQLLAEFAELPGASPLRMWPHHFDIATLIAVDARGSGERPRRLEVGLSPGDSAYPQPYFYVRPWPYPARELPRLSAGHWNTVGWTGALLTGTEVARRAPDDRCRFARDFLNEALEVSRRLLDG